MNNSDYNDFDQWQNGDYEENNPNNHFPFNFWKFNYNPKYSEQFRKMFENMNKGEGMDDLANYLNLNEAMKEHSKQQNRKNAKKTYRKSTVVQFTHDEYMRLIEIRGYLAITEQYAHVKALDKVINQIQMIPIPPRQKD
jgi:O-glycosyl hydrolase